MSLNHKYTWLRNTCCAICAFGKICHPFVSGTVRELLSEESCHPNHKGVNVQHPSTVLLVSNFQARAKAFGASNRVTACRSKLTVYVPLMDGVPC